MNKTHFFCTKTVDETIDYYDTTYQGLSDQQARKRLTIYGYNILQETNTSHRRTIILNQFQDFMIVLLLVSSGLARFLGDYRTSVVLLLIVLFNIVIGYYQESKAEKILENLKKLIDRKARVIREGKQQEIEAELLVPGDIVMIEEGDNIPADLRLIEQTNLGTNDFSLTGESNPVKKFTYPLDRYTHLGDANNLVFMGTTVATGRGKGVVIATGMDTQIGAIAHLTQSQSAEQSPLQQELNTISLKLAQGTGILALVLFVIALYLDMGLYYSFLFALGIAASMVPQGLPAQINTALTIASSRLALHNILLKKLSSAETMGAVSVICTDKTGTLTKNEMTIQHIFVGYHQLKVSGTGYKPQGRLLDKHGQPLDPAIEQQMNRFITVGMLASNATIHAPDHNNHNRYCIGDPTEGAVVTLAQKYGLQRTKLLASYLKQQEFGFDSMRKRMSVIYQHNGERYLVVKGAPEAVLAISNRYYDGQKEQHLTSDDRMYFSQLVDTISKQAYRNLAYAYKKLDLDKHYNTYQDCESDLVFLGMVAMSDPPREHVEDAIRQAYEANIKVVIITGDYALTAEAIARNIGMADDIITVDGQELSKKTDIQILRDLHHKAVIFSRVSPADKLRIVDLLKKNGHIVAVTGDGINDAPALKKADIGVAMAKIGSDVAKDTADMLLLDDNFVTLVKAIREGRVIYANIKKNILACLTSNGGELFVVLRSLLIAGIWGLPLAISPLLILCIDLIGEMGPLMALTNDPPQHNIMKEKPRNIHDHIINQHTIFDLIGAGFVMGTLSYLSFIVKLWFDGMIMVSLDADSDYYATAKTLTYVTILMIQYVNILGRRPGYQSIFTSYLFTNRILRISFALSGMFILLIVYQPYINQLVGSGPLGRSDWLIAIIAAFIYGAYREGIKYYYRTKGYHA